jgi:hypothetical protein
MAYTLYRAFVVKEFTEKESVMQKRIKLKKIKKLSDVSNASFVYGCDEGCDLESGDLCETCLEWVELKRQSPKRKGDKDQSAQ